MTEVLDLGRLAAVNVFLMLDTIAWDIVYGGAGRAGRDVADTSRRTQTASCSFPSSLANGSWRGSQRHLSVQTGVVHLSLDAEDYLDRKDRDRPDEPYWLVVGNTYDHKHVRSTLDLLTRAFPTRRFVALGDTGPSRSDRVTRLTSGATEEQRLQSAYAGADVTIYPSFYEGFGLPHRQRAGLGVHRRRARVGAGSRNRCGLSRTRAPGHLRRRGRAHRLSLSSRPRTDRTGTFLCRRPVERIGVWLGGRCRRHRDVPRRPDCSTQSGADARPSHSRFTLNRS